LDVDTPIGKYMFKIQESFLGRSRLQGPVMDMFWGDRCGTVVDQDGYPWMVGTHKAEPTAEEMKKGMLEMMRQPTDTAAAA
jgi:hypothetical protein